MKSNIIQFSNLLHDNQFYETILSWFKQNQRNLYWRENRTIYLTYLTEVMLQQTTVSTVQNKLPTILKEFPDFKSFKSKKINDFLKCWSGLGYYNRAINFYKSASIINKNFKGNLPDNKDDLLNLPGVGEYTANAIISIGYNKRAFPIDVNIKRLISRLTNESFSDQQASEILNNIAIKKRNFRKFAESMMDYSSLICKKNYPQCQKCKFQNYCKSAFTKFSSLKKNKILSKNINFYLLENKNHICFIKNPKFQFYKNFLHLPSSLDTELLSKYKKNKKTLKSSFQYSITKYRFKINVHEIFTKKIIKDHDIVWLKKSEISQIPIPTLFKKILN